LAIKSGNEWELFTLFYPLPRERNIQPYRPMSYEKGRQADMQLGRWAERQTKIIIGRQQDVQRELQADRKTKRITGRQRDRQK
jgi:hypothetical protein